MCHAQIYNTYQSTGMARGFAPAARAPAIEEYGQKSEFFHSASGRHYSVSRRGAQIYQRRFELNSKGERVNEWELEATHSIGSGNHARTYLHRSGMGEYTELPLTWYSKEKRWDMSPGFDTATPADFTRVVDERCLFCHNGYPDESGNPPEGIDCQRCHGPGARHVAAASTLHPQRTEIVAAIVNPSRLSPEHRLDVCLQCHLETTSAELPAMILRFDRAVNSFRPGEDLGAYAVQFEDASSSGRFEVVSQGYRLRQSACFLKSQGRMGCITCHDPHQQQTNLAEYRTKCLSCHTSVASAAHPSLQTSDCVSCHMVKRSAEDAIHVTMTDHRIEKYPANRVPGKASAGKPSLYYPAQLAEPERELYLGAALIVGGRGLREGINMLRERLRADTPAKAVAVLGEGYLADGNSASAIDLFQRSLAKNPAQPKARYNLGQAMAAAGRYNEAREAYLLALRLRPAFPEAEFALANVLLKTGDTAGAETHYRIAIRLRPNYAAAHNNLGSLYVDKEKFDDSRKEITEALRIDPALADAYSNFARLLASQRQLPAAIEHARKAVSLDGRNPVAEFNLAQLLQETGALPAAIAAYRRVLDLDPGFIDAHLRLAQALGDAGQLDQAIVEFREVLRLRPAHAAARQGLEMATALQRGGR